MRLKRQPSSTVREEYQTGVETPFGHMSNKDIQNMRMIDVNWPQRGPERASTPPSIQQDKVLKNVEQQAQQHNPEVINPGRTYSRSVSPVTQTGSGAQASSSGMSFVQR